MRALCAAGNVEATAPPFAMNTKSLPAGLFLEIPRNGFVDRKTRDEDVQKPRPVAASARRPESRRAHKPPILQRKAVRLRGETRRGGANHIDVDSPVPLHRRGTRSLRLSGPSPETAHSIAIPSTTLRQPYP